MIQYRLASPADSAQLAEMRWNFRIERHPEAVNMTRETFLEACTAFYQRVLAGDGWSCWLAEENGTILSTIFIERVERIPTPKSLISDLGYITNVYTRPAYRQKGIGAELMKHVQDWARTQDLDRLFLWPSERAVPFYLRGGFTMETQEMEFSL
jgi:GNAT superfamily N-acetyltransferase